MPRKKETGKAANGLGTIRQKTVTRNGKEYPYWEGRYTVGFDPGTGKQIQRSITGKTQKEVAQKLKAATAALDETQTKAFLAAIKGHPLETLFTVTLFTGLRKGETLGLRWDCVDFKRGTILIDKQLQREKKKGSAYVFAPLKNDKSRTVTPAPWVMQLLKHHRAVQAEQRLKIGPMREDSGLVFTTETGRHLDIHTIQRAFKPIVASIGCPEARFHDLRHSYAVAAIHSGDDIKTVQGNLGHAPPPLPWTCMGTSPTK